MALTDPIADLLTRIRNAILAGHSELTLPTSKIKAQIAGILQQEGYINEFELLPDAHQQGALRITLRFDPNGDSAIRGLKRVSRPGRRIYRGFRDLPRVRNGLGIAILSTSNGVLSDRDARTRKVGGEVLCYIW